MFVFVLYWIIVTPCFTGYDIFEYDVINATLTVPHCYFTISANITFAFTDRIHIFRGNFALIR